MQRYQKLSNEIDKVRQKVQKSNDTQDKSLEVQLAENKLKEGRFKMASMYVDSLKDELDVE
jgi:nitrate/TMAO reductase-like tetraheme cytochrome c subunit